MKRICLYISLVGISSCVTSKQSSSSNSWVVLNSAKEIKCESWPLAEKDLEVTNIIPIAGKGSNNGAIGVVRQRNSSIQNVFIPLNSSFELDTDQAMIIPIAQSSNVLGAWLTDAGPIALVSNKLGERSTFELRSVKENKILTKSQFVIDDVVTDAEFEVHDKNYWVTLKSGDYTSNFIKLTLDGKNSSIEKIPVTSSSRGARIVYDKSGKTPLVLEPQVEGQKLQVKIKKVGVKLDQIKTIGEISISSKGAPESWTFSSSQDGFFYTAVFGDSMVGQGVLNSGRYSVANGNATLTWNSETQMTDLHLSEPMIVSNSSSSYLTILKWLDDASTAEINQLENQKISPKGNFGVMPKGSAIVNAVSSDTGNITAALRQKIKDSWKFSLCRLPVR